MNATQIKLTLVFLVFAVIGFGPVSPGCLIGMFVVVMRPLWFHRMIHALYTGKTKPHPNGSPALMQVQSLTVLLTLFIIDILPFPVTPSLVLPLIFIRPAWMYQVVETLYASDYRKTKGD